MWLILFTLGPSEGWVAYSDQSMLGTLRSEKQMADGTIVRKKHL